MTSIIAMIASFLLLAKSKLEKTIKFQKEILLSVTKHAELQCEEGKV
jgi:hypothetical protein